MLALIVSTFIFLVTSPVYAANILACLPTPSYSHQIAYTEIWKELSLRGHNVTLITTDPVRDEKLTNLTEIDVHFTYEVFRDISSVAENVVHSWNFQPSFRPMFKGISEAQLSYGKVQDLLHNRENYKFDLVLTEFLFPEFLAFAELYDCPKIIFSSLDASVIFHNAIGNTIHPALYPDILAPFYPPLSFWERVQNTLYTWFVLYYLHHYTYADKDEAIRKFFNVTMTTAELINDTDLLFLNVNQVINNVRVSGPTTIHIGDISKVSSSKQLPQDLQEFLDSAEEGFIYFSLGSNVKSKELNRDSLQSIIETLSEVPYKVLWKFEDDFLPGKPENVKLVKWAPQLAVLAHRNIKLFVTQGGLQSMEEGIHSEVPFVVIPFFADQDQNALLMKSKGIAEVVERIPFIRKDDLKKTVLEVINNPIYGNAVKRLKHLALDMPMTGVEKAVWWTEYVIRNKGAKHLRNPTADLPLYQYYLVDVIAFLTGISVVLLGILVIVLKKVIELIKIVTKKPYAKNKKIE